MIRSNKEERLPYLIIDMNTYKPTNLAGEWWWVGSVEVLDRALTKEEVEER